TPARERLSAQRPLAAAKGGTRGYRGPTPSENPVGLSPLTHGTGAPCHPQSRDGSISFTRHSHAATGTQPSCGRGDPAERDRTSRQLVVAPQRSGALEFLRHPEVALGEPGLSAALVLVRVVGHVRP